MVEVFEETPRTKGLALDLPAGPRIAPARTSTCASATLSTSTSFWAAAAIAFLAFARNTAASPLYRVFQAQFRFSATTLTLLFALYNAVLLLTLLSLGSVSGAGSSEWLDRNDYRATGSMITSVPWLRD